MSVLDEPSGAPHWPQNFGVPGFGWPQAGQVKAMGRSESDYRRSCGPAAVQDDQPVEIFQIMGALSTLTFPSTSLHRRETFQFLEPVLHDVDVQERGLRLLAGLDDEEVLVVGRDIPLP